MPDLHIALPVLLQSFAEPLRREAERLAEDGAIITLDLQDNRLDAEVMLDDKPVHVCWQMKQGRWQGDHDADEHTLGDLACCLALVGVKRDIPETGSATQEPVKETFQLAVERILGRQLLPGEESYLSKVEKRFERVQKTKEIFDQDMVRLHPKWAIQSYEPLALWAESPATPLEFWNYVALALHERGLPFPAFLKAATDLNATRGKLASFRQDRSVPQWVERVRRFVTPKKEQGSEHEITDVRLRITTSDAKLQVFHSGGFHTVAPEQLEGLRRDHARGALRLPAEAELLLVECLLQLGHSEVESFRLELDRHANWLATLFVQEALNTRLVSLDETPFQHSDQVLRWVAIEAADGQGITLKLELPGGTPPPAPLRVLQARDTLYLSGDMLFHGPLWFGEDTAVEPQIQIPLPALSSSDGIAFLDKLNVPLPQCLASRIRREPLGVEIVAHCTKAAAGSTQYAHFRVTAASPDGKHTEVLRGNKWITETSPPRSDGLIMCHDRSALAQAEDLLEGVKASFDEDLDVFRSRMTKTFPETFYEWAQNLPPDVEFKPDPSLQTILADPLIARVRLEATQTATIDWFDLRVVFDVEGVDLKPADIRRLIAAKGGFVRLADGTWRRVKLELAEDQQEMVELLGIDLNELSDEAHRVHWRHLAGERGAEVLEAEAWRKLQDRMTAVQLYEKPEVPTSLSLTLRPYQVDGFHFLSYLTVNRFGGILADDMGLGKTVQTIAWVLWLRDRWTSSEAIPPTLVVCPKSVLDVWAQEFTKAARHVRVQVLHDRDELDVSALNGGVDVLVMNYAQLRSCIESLKNIHFLATILDEGQQIKNPDSKASKAARELRSHNRLVLTGTPLENRLLDLWSLMSFATPGALGDRGYFHKHFDRRKDERASQRLSARLRPFILRRTKGQVARELPPRTEENLLCEMSGMQDQLYRDELSRAQQMVLTANGKDALSKRRFAILQALTRLRQVCCHPALVQKDAIEEESAKLTAALDLIEQLHEEGHKVLLFSQFVSMLKIIREKLEKMNIPYHWLTGASEDRAGIVRRFQEDEQASTFLISLKAGGSGLNLTAASYVILFDPWWNPAVENQAIDRAHRIGQTQPVIAYRLISRNTIEEKILMLQQHKQMLSSDILGEASFAQNLGKEDFEFLLGMEDRMEAKSSSKVRVEKEEW